MANGYLGSLLPGVLQELHVESRRRRYRDDPALWAEDYLGLQLWSKQREIAQSICDNRYTAVAAGHGVGKSYVAAVIACWWIDVHPLGETKTFVATTAPSKDQVDLIWGNIRTFHALAKQRFEKGLVDHELPGYITGDNKWKLADGQTIGQGRKPPDSKSDVAFQGRHADYLLAIGDEAVGLTEGFLNALGVIATGDQCRILLLANPTDPGSAMAKLWPDSEGRGGNPDWTRIHIGVMDSPMLTKEEGFDLSRAEGLSGQKFLDWAIQEYGGEEDARYQARVLGQWAWDNGKGLFPEEVIGRATRTRVIVDPLAPKSRFGVDVSRAGVDSTQVYLCEEGTVWHTDPETDEPIYDTQIPGYRIRYVDSWSGAPITSSNPEKLGTAQRLNQLAKEYRVEVVNIDASGGLGVGVFDAIHELDDQGDFYMYEVFGNDRKGVDSRAFVNLRAKAFSELKKMMAAGTLDLDINDKALLDELRGIRYKFDAKQALQIESKDEMKKRGAKSPDRADALWYAWLDSMEAAGLRQPGDVVEADVAEHISNGSFWFAGDGIARYGW